MLKKLYRSVFNLAERDFDRERDYLTVFVNLGTEEDVFKRLENSINHYLDDNSIERLEDISSLECEKIVDRLRSRQTYRHGIDTNYTFLIDFFALSSNDARNKLNAYLYALRVGKILKSGDRVTVIVILPDDARKSEFLHDIEDLLGQENIFTYVFIKEKFQVDLLIDNICSALVINSEKEMYAAVERNIKQANNAIESNISGLSEEGRAIYAGKKPVVWSSVSAVFGDGKMSFLKSHFKYLLSNTVTIDSVDFADCCTKFYDDHIGTKNYSRWKKLLAHSINLIPRITNVNSTENSLYNYFDQIFGTRGAELVDLTMKVNLKSLNKFEPQHIEQAIDSILRYVDGINSNDIITDILRELSAYIAKKDDEINTHREVLKNARNNGSDVSIDLPVYIEKYINFTAVVRQREFWERVRFNMETNRERFVESVNKAKELEERIDEILDDLMFERNLNCYNVKSKYRAGDLLSDNYSEELKNGIREAYFEFESQNIELSEDERLEWDKNEFFESIYPTIRADYSYEYEVRGVYSLKVQQRIFKYFEFPVTEGCGGSNNV